MKQPLTHIPFSALALVVLLTALFAACLPGRPTATLVPTLDPTLIAVAAEATVTEIARAKAPTVSRATATLPPAATATQPPPGDFWTTYLYQHKIRVMNADGTQSALLTNTPGSDYLPTWSPDGKTLAFIRFNGLNHADGTLNLLAPGSNTPRELDPNNTYSRLVWTPDSQQLLVMNGNTDAFQVFLIDVSSGQPLQVAKNVSEFPRLSPDGKKIALLITGGSPCSSKGCLSPNDIYIYDMASRQTTRVTGDSTPKIGLSWSPDGQQLAVHQWDDPNNQVDIYTPDGKQVATKQAAPWWTSDWQRSPDGKQYAYYINDTNNSAVDIFVRPLDGEARKVTRVEKTPEAAAYINTLRWRPDGSGLVFDFWTKIYTVNLDGSGLRPLPLTVENVFFDVRPTTDAYTPAPEPTAPASWKLCPGGLDSRLDVGRQAQVTTDPPTPNNVRGAPGKSAKLLGQIEPGEKVEITNGPVCDRGFIWWEVKSLTTGLKGYTLEGDLKDYWLVPVK